MKKTLSVILATLIIFSALTFAPFSVTAVTSGDYTYKILDDNTIEITGYNGNAVDLVIPETIDGYTVTRIGEDAFEEALTIKTVTISDTITYIGWGAFSQCPKLETVIISDSVKKIDSYAFFSCQHLYNISIGKSVEEIRTSAFDRSYNIKTITVDSNNPKFDSRDNCNAIIETATNKLVIGVGTTIIPDTVTCIGSNAFMEANALTKIKIPDSVTTIESLAFAHSQNIEEIQLGNSVESIGYCAFLNCPKLKKINFPDSLTTIEDRAFDHCLNLLKIHIPANLTSLGKQLFTECQSLNKITVDSENKVYDSRNDCNAVIITDTNTLLFGSNNTVIPDTVTEIASLAFYGRSGITEITIPDSVTKICSYAFYDCNNLKDITISAAVRTIDEKAIGIIGPDWYPEHVEGLTIHGYNGTIAQYYANALKFDFVSLGDPPADINSTPLFYKGDVDGNFYITIFDATKIQRHLANLERLEGLYLQPADYDDDGEITIMDATHTQIFVSKIILYP